MPALLSRDRLRSQLEVESESDVVVDEFVSLFVKDAKKLREVCVCDSTAVFGIGFMLLQ